MGLAEMLRKVVRRPYATVRAREVTALLDAGATLLDVRERAEWRSGRAPKARHVPLGELAARVGELPKGRPVVTVCRSGMRSARAAAVLAGQGWEVYNLAGGMRAWAGAGLPVVANGGRQGSIV
jgi:rhodanese-related sulfurtransferase